VSFITFGTRCGFDRARILQFTEECVGPAAMILLVVGAGGGFSKVLDAAGVDQAILDRMAGVNLSPLLLGWLMAALLRVAVGSATVAITLAAGILSPLVSAMPGVNLEILIVAMGAGSLFLSHLNDGGFWFVKESLNLSVAETLKTWTVLETILAVSGLALVLALDALIRYCF
jgi:GntP family gluconate:H+ symporter